MKMSKKFHKGALNIIILVGFASNAYFRLTKVDPLCLKFSWCEKSFSFLSWITNSPFKRLVIYYCNTDNSVSSGKRN